MALSTWERAGQVPARMPLPIISLIFDVLFDLQLHYLMCYLLCY
jgi:hypothetical protein